MSLTTRTAATLTATLGLVPFIVLAVSFVIDGPIFPGFALQGFMVWSALVLTFIGAVRWGGALNLGKSGPMEMALGIVPSMLAWVGVVISVRHGVLVLMGGYLLALAFDHWRPLPTGPDWYLPLRRWLSLVVLALHGFMVWAVWY